MLQAACHSCMLSKSDPPALQPPFVGCVSCLAKFRSLMHICMTCHHVYQQ
jgi:hypothetical protein